MKIRLEIGSGRYAEIKNELLALGMEVDDTADLVLREATQFVQTLTTKTMDGSEIVRVPVEEIICIESFGHDVEVHTESQCLKTADRLYQILISLDPECFIRISNSVIVSKSKIKNIRPALSQKYHLTLTTGEQVDVTRTYYYAFREALGI